MKGLVWPSTSEWVRAWREWSERVSEVCESEWDTIQIDKRVFFCLIADFLCTFNLYSVLSPPKCRQIDLNLTDLKHIGYLAIACLCFRWVCIIIFQHESYCIISKFSWEPLESGMLHMWFYCCDFYLKINIVFIILIFIIIYTFKRESFNTGMLHVPCNRTIGCQFMILSCLVI